MHHLVNVLSRAASFRDFAAARLRGLAVGVGLAGVIGFIMGWVAVTRAPSNTQAATGLFLLLSAVAVYAVIHLLWIRADHIARLPESEYVAIPVASLFIRLLGEAYAAVTALLGLAGAIMIWFAGRGPAEAAPQAGPFAALVEVTASVFLAGLAVILYAAFVAFAALIVSHLIAELILVMADMATHKRAMRYAMDRLAPPPPQPGEPVQRKDEG